LPIFETRPSRSLPPDEFCLGGFHRGPAAGSGMGAVTARRFRDEGADVVLTGRTREKLTKVVSQFDQERSLIHVSDMTKPGRRPTDSARQDW
jgi:hypothetical protein